MRFWTSGCTPKHKSTEIELEVVSTYIGSDGVWHTIAKRKDNIRTQWEGRLGEDGDKFPVAYIPGLKGGTYKLTPR